MFFLFSQVLLCEFSISLTISIKEHVIPATVEFGLLTCRGVVLLG